MFYAKIFCLVVVMHVVIKDMPQAQDLLGFDPHAFTGEKQTTFTKHLCYALRYTTCSRRKALEKGVLVISTFGVRF